jgi:hypothetical protein
MWATANGIECQDKMAIFGTQLAATLICVQLLVYRGLDLFAPPSPLETPFEKQTRLTPRIARTLTGRLTPL